MQTVHPTVSRVLVIGLDGATFDVLQPLVAAGRMPKLQAFMDRAALQVARSTEPPITPVAWSTFQTGAPPESHGVWDYRRLDHAARRLVLNQAPQLAGRTLFEAVSAAGGRVVSLNLPMTYPQLPGIAGLVVGGLDAPSMRAALAPHAQLAAEIARRGIRFSLSPVWRRKPLSREELVRLTQETADDFTGRAAVAELADELADWQLLFVQFQTLDAWQHRCWHLLGVDEHAPAPRDWTDVGRVAWRALDESIGRLCELAAQRGAAVVLVSDHGFGSFSGRINVPELLARRGLLRYQGLGGALRFRAQRTWWKLQKSFRRRLRPGQSLAPTARPLQALLPIDWRQTTAYTLHGNLGALVYLNTHERTGGPLTTPRQVDQALADAQAAFLEAAHPETGERLFTHAYAVRDRLGCDPCERQAPDLLALPAAGWHTWHKLDPLRRLVHSDPTLTGTHRPEGVLMIDAPGVPRDRPGPVDLADAAPTILSLLGLPPLPTMTGRSLHAAVTAGPPAAGSPDRAALQPAATAAAPAAAFRSESPPQRSESPAQRSESPAQRSESAVDACVEDRLRDLGYLD